MKYEAQIDTRDNCIIHVQKSGVPWGYSDVKPPFRIDKLAGDESEFEDLRARSKAGGGDGKKTAEEIQLEEEKLRAFAASTPEELAAQISTNDMFATMTDEEIRAEYEKRNLDGDPVVIPGG
jgi:hypothetical protein